MVIFSKRVLIAWLTLSPVFALQVTTHAYAEAALAPEVSLEELKSIVSKKSATIIDVNSPKSYADAHIPGAIHFEKNKVNLAKVLPADKTSLIVAYCGGPLCTAWEDAAKAVKALGYTNIKHFKGGIKTWTSTGQTTEKSS